MGSLNDLILQATGGPTINDGLSAWFNKTSNESLQDAERRFLLAATGAEGTSNDLWLAYLRSLGLTGALNDMLRQYWGGAPVKPLPPPFSVDSGWEVQGVNLIDWDLTRWVSSTYPLIRYYVNQLAEGQDIIVRGNVTVLDGTTPGIQIRAGDDVAGQIVLNAAGVFEDTITMDDALLQGVQIICGTSATTTKITIDDLEILPQ